MKSKIKIIAQEINIETNEVVTEYLAYEKITTVPQQINELGFSHKEQINILHQSQEAILQAQQKIINEQNDTCPECSHKTKKSGKFQSDFHSVFTDHKISLQRKKCTCGWTSKISIDGKYASALHPDLVEMQCLFGAESSFKKTEAFLAKKCCASRPINNHSRIQKTINQVGYLLSVIKQEDDWFSSNDPNFSDELILAIDGGYIQSHDADKRSFEALTATVYNPNNLVRKDKNHSEIIDKTVVASAKNDHQISIKRLVKNACKKQGMNLSTKITFLTDGAKNCWSIASVLEGECKEIVKILDWFHIGKKFKNAEHVIPEELKDEYEKSKWCLWQGNVDKALMKLDLIKGKIDNEKTKIGTLITYIKNNQAYLINYQERDIKGLVYTSQLAESTVNNLINERQKHDKRMQWSREGADAVLQIRSSKQSNDWESDWNSVQAIFYRKAS